MPSLSPVHLALFASGALIGAGAAVYTTKPNNNQLAPPVNAPPTNLPSKLQPSPTKSPTHSPQDTVRFGFPGPISDIVRREAYIAAYDRAKRHPAWTAEHLTPASVARDPNSPTDRKNSQFKEDYSIPEMFRARLSEYYRSGYDRGHLVPAADVKSSQSAMDETFYLTNIAPQVGPGFNREYWAYVEGFCRNLTKEFNHVYIFTLPLYIPSKGVDNKWRVTYEVLGDPLGKVPTISVPTHFAKVILTSKDEGHQNLAMASFVLPNMRIADEIPLTHFLQPVDNVERAAGFNLFNDKIKSSSKHLCTQTKCEQIIRKFDEFGKQISGPKK